MKKTASLILVLLICFCVCACKQTPELEYNYDYTSQQAVTPVQTKPKEFSSYDAYLVASEFIEDYYNAALKNEVRKANSIDYFKIASYKNNGDDGKYYKFTFYGTFAARDKYGDLLDFYKYTWKINISKYEHEDFNIIFYNDGYGDISVQKD